MHIEKNRLPKKGGEIGGKLGEDNSGTIAYRHKPQIHRLYYVNFRNTDWKREKGLRNSKVFPDDLGVCPRIERPTTETPFWPDFPSIIVK